ncbi:PAAR domain-containing protein [Pseudomonas sp. B21-047]|uniref:PAAR domain-containing protein n=1 Tax=Pseudomonas sp. B21-047 TaxID=2895489 RepID=UPI00215E86C8|nr:PAAR domain-containing protein [Pseudomonas sp. B21-047]UVL02148.1 PAAR domain-containing protein [Pseudomonas sp. B21-047]
MRVNLGGKGQAVDGDVTTTGAICIAAGLGYLSNGRRVLREGDKTTPCPRCGEQGTVVEGVRYFISNGQAVAMDGALVACGCPSGSNRVVAPLGAAPLSRQALANSRAMPTEAAAGAHPKSLVQGAVTAMPGTLEPGFYVVPKSMSFSQVLLQLSEHDATLPISRLQRLNPTFEQGFKAGEIFVIGDPDNSDACTLEEAKLMAAAQDARRALAVLDFAESDFMVQHQAEIAGLLSSASQSMGVGKDMLDQGLKQVKSTLNQIEQLHQREFLRHGHLNSREFFASRRQLLQQLDVQLKAALLNKQLNLGNYERLKKSLNISTKSLVHHWSKAGGVGQIPGYATHLDQVARLSKFIKYGGHVGVGIGGASSYLKVQGVCRAGEAAACKKVRFTETGSFSGGLVGGMLASGAMGAVAGTLCGAISIGTGGLAIPVCGIVLVGTGGLAGSTAGEAFGESAGEFIYEVTHD